MSAIHDTVVIPCPSCGGRLERRYSTDGLHRYGEALACLDCLWSSGGMRSAWAKTDEGIKRGDAPLREITDIDRGYEGEGMTFYLSCGHKLTLQRRAYRFEQKRVRCVQCQQSESSQKAPAESSIV